MSEGIDPSSTNQPARNGVQPPNHHGKPPQNDWTSETAWVGTRQPLQAATTLPAEAYTDRKFFEIERRRVFGSSWVFVATSDQLSSRRLLVRSVAGKSVILTRNLAGEPQCFLNSCRHRGTQLAESDCEVAKTIRCPYHRWGYDLEGNLVSTPRFDEAGINDFDPADYGLHRVRVQQWGCLVFVCLDPATVNLDEWLGDLTLRLKGYQLDQWRTVASQDLRIKANWKLISENFQEYYHLSWVHPELAKVSRVADHYRYQGTGMYCGQTTTPVTSDSRDDWTAMAPAGGLNESDLASGRFITVFPNVLLSVLPNHVFIMALNPISPGVTDETCIFLLPPNNDHASPSSASDKAFKRTQQFWFEINQEDIDIVERGQRGLEKGGFTVGRLSPRFEEPLHRFHNMMADRFVGLDRIPSGDPNDSDPRLGTGANPVPYLSPH